jgi:hypothetical protein
VQIGEGKKATINWKRVQFTGHYTFMSLPQAQQRSLKQEEELEADLVAAAHSEHVSHYTVELPPWDKPLHDWLRSIDDVALQAEGYSGVKVEYLGVFKWQEKVLQGRPTYKKPEKDEYLFYTNEGFWKVGSDTSKAVGDCHWLVKSTARTPSAITEPWTVFDGSKWVEVPAAKVRYSEAAKVRYSEVTKVRYSDAVRKLSDALHDEPNHGAIRFLENMVGKDLAMEAPFRQLKEPVG